MNYLTVKNGDIAHLPKEKVDAFYEFLKSCHFTFTHTNMLKLVDDSINKEKDIYKKYTFYPKLEVLVISDYIFEAGLYDDWTECNPELFKVKTVEEAWDYVKENIADWWTY